MIVCIFKILVEFKKISEAYNVLSDPDEKSKYDRIIGNYDADEANVYKDIGKKDFKYKKTHGLDEEELKIQETEHQRILKRKHEREADLISKYVNMSMNRVWMILTNFRLWLIKKI